MIKIIKNQRKKKQTNLAFKKKKKMICGFNKFI